MYSERLENLINAALIDGVLTEKERNVLINCAEDEGIDPEEFEIVLNARLIEMRKQKEAENNTNTEIPAPKSDKLGNIRKCPACGAIVNSYQGVCSECGHEFENISANNSSTKLFEELKKYYDTKEKKEIIETFPIPITKADLIEFLTSMKPKILDISDPLSSSYLKKYTECIEKAKVAFEGDKILQKFINEFPQIKSQISKKKNISLTKSCFQWAISHYRLSLTFILIIIVTTCSIKLTLNDKRRKRSMAADIAQFDKYITNNDLDGTLNVLKNGAKVGYERRLDLMKKFIAKNDVNSAIYVFDRTTPDHPNMYEINFGSLYGEQACDYSKKAAEIIYNALLKAERMDDAWDYHQLDYESKDYYGNAKCYFSYMTDVIAHYCKNGKKSEAKKFLKEHIDWFVKNVDTEKGTDSYKDFNSKVVLQQLTQKINTY